MGVDPGDTVGYSGARRKNERGKAGAALMVREKEKETPPFRAVFHCQVEGKG
jgi:hypothetical protein